MKIMYLVHQFYPVYYTGTEKFVFNLACQEQRWGNQVVIVTWGKYPGAEIIKENENICLTRHFYHGLEVLAYYYKRNEPSDFLMILNDKKVTVFAEYIFENITPDLIHVGHPMKMGEFIQEGRRLKIPVLVTLTDYWLMCPRSILVNTVGKICWGPEKCSTCANDCSVYNNDYLKSRFEQAVDLLKDASGVFSPSIFLARIFNHESSVANVEVINHGLEIEKFNENRRVYNSKSAITFIYAGSLSPHKGIHVLIKAFKGIVSKSARLIIYGSGQQQVEGFLRFLAKDDERIFFAGVFNDENIASVYHQADVVVVPSLWFENYPLVLHEALCSNIPVVTSDIGGMKEKIKNNFNGLTFHVGDVGDLMAKMQIIVNGPDILNYYKQNIQKSLLPSIEQEAYLYRKVYSESII